MRNRLASNTCSSERNFGKVVRGAYDTSISYSFSAPCWNFRAIGGYVYEVASLLLILPHDAFWFKFASGMPYVPAPGLKLC